MEANRRAGIAGPGEAEELLEACFAPQCQAKVSVFNLVTLANGCVASASFRRETLDALEKNIDDAERLLIAHEGALVPHYLAMLLACSNNKLSACEVLEIIGARPGMTKTYTPMEALAAVACGEDLDVGVRAMSVACMSALGVPGTYITNAKDVLSGER